MKKIHNVLPLITIIIIGLSIIGVIKCDADKLDKHLNKCKEICKPNEVIEILSRKKCICREVIKEDITPLE